MFPKIKNILDNKNILILGYGREGKSTLCFLKDHIKYNSLTVADKCVIEDDSLSGIDVLFGDSYMDNIDEFDVIIKSPGIVYDQKKSSVIDKTISQTDMFLLEFSDKTVGVTGTKGKSTTTSLIYDVLKKNGKNALLLGNIGIPPLDVVNDITDDSIAVFEMSCHQLEYAKISPRIAVIVNLYEDHLDHYGNRENYVKAKENIFLNQKSTDLFIVNYECVDQIKKAHSNVIRVGDDSSCDYYVSSGCINNDYVIPKTKSLIGEHNNFNISLAYAVAKNFNVSDKAFSDAVLTFKGLPHRLEYVATKYGVEYYDDSISTIPQTTIQAIKSLKNVKTVILGGMDRGIDYSELVDFLCYNSVENIILLPGAGERIGQMLSQKNIKFVFAVDLNDAVNLSKNITVEGGICLLSPAAASYGYFKNFEERGNAFKDLVNKL